MNKKYSSGDMYYAYLGHSIGFEQKDYIALLSSKTAHETNTVTSSLCRLSPSK